MALLRRPEVRFVVAGGTVAALYAGMMVVLVVVAGLPDQAALAIAYALAVFAHFNLQRRFVFADDKPFALSAGQQARRFLVVVGLQYGFTAAGLWLLTEQAGLPTLAAYALVAPSGTVLTFAVMRTWLFHVAAEQAQAPSSPAGSA